MTDNTPTTKQEEGELGALVERLTKLLARDHTRLPWVEANLANITVHHEVTATGSVRQMAYHFNDNALATEAVNALPQLLAALSAPAIPPHNEDGLRKALERLRPPLSVDAFNEVSAGKADFMAMILRADGEGCQDILAQQMQDQAARDIVEIINAVPALLQALGDIPSG